MVRFADLRYLPTLLLGQQELTAISKLTSAEKDLLFPLFRLRPWRGKKPFSRALEKVLENLGDRPFACDLDSAYQAGADRLAVREFDAIKADHSGRGWYDLVQPFERAIPCLRLTASAEEIAEAIRQPWMAERGFGILLSKDNQADHHKLEPILEQIDHNNFFVVVDAGWSKNLLLEAAWATALVLRVFQVNRRAALFLSSSSFPKAFGDMGENGEVGEISMAEFSLHEEVARQVALKFNESRVQYADWATTRPPSPGGGTWVPRIDVPGDRVINAYRDWPKVEQGEGTAETCIRLAKVAVKQPGWPSPPPSWGHYSVDLTASGAESGIYHQNINTASRINMYLHRALSTPAGLPPSLEEKFEG